VCSPDLGNPRATVLLTLPPGDAEPDEDDVVAFDVEIATRDGKRLIGTQKAPRTPRPPADPGPVAVGAGGGVPPEGGGSGGRVPAGGGGPDRVRDRAAAGPRGRPRPPLRAVGGRRARRRRLRPGGHQWGVVPGLPRRPGTPPGRGG